MSLVNSTKYYDEILFTFYPSYSRTSLVNNYNPNLTNVSMKGQKKYSFFKIHLLPLRFVHIEKKDIVVWPKCNLTLWIVKKTLLTSSKKIEPNLKRKKKRKTKCWLLEKKTKGYEENFKKNLSLSSFSLPMAQYLNCYHALLTHFINISDYHPFAFGYRIEYVMRKFN